MGSSRLSFVFLGLSITSSWGNGHATTYRGLVRELGALGHNVLFLERDTEWYRENRDLPRPPYCRTELYGSLEQLFARFGAEVARADVVVVGSYVPEGKKVGEWVLRNARGVRAFYDIDTPVTLQSLGTGTCEYLSSGLLRRYDLYLSFTGGKMLERIEQLYGAARALPLYCSADTELYYPESVRRRWALGYLGTYSEDRQPALEELLLRPARSRRQDRFVVAGPQYPGAIAWPANVQRMEHVPPAEHRAFYCAQRFALNITRKDMVRAGFSPSVRLFEAAACGTPVVSDAWEGLDTFFAEDSEILVARDSSDVLRVLSELSERERSELGRRARARVLREHTAAHRAATLERYVRDFLGTGSRARAAHPS
jgi:spore maturation protein CgeB